MTSANTVDNSKNKRNDTLEGILTLLFLGGIAVGIFLLVGGLIAAIMNPIIASTSSGGHVWAIGYLIWLIFYPTGLIRSCFLIGAISIVVGIGSYFFLDEKNIFIKESKENNSNSDTTSQKPTNKDYSEIEAEITEITRWIGVSEPINTTALFEKVLDGEEKEVIDIIANQLSLPMRITTKHCSEKKYKKDGSSPLAEVSVGNIPHYGSSSLKHYPCVITLYPGYNSRPDRFIYVIAHELCHYILQSLRPHLHDSNKEERLTDLAVIFGGFESAYRTGWQSNIHGNAGYYLDKYDIEYIRRRYEKMLVDRRRKFEIISAQYKDLIKEQSNTLLFTKMYASLLEHPNEKIAKDDMEAIGKCFALVEKEEIERISKLRSYLKPFLYKKVRYGEMANDEEYLAELTKLIKGIVLPDEVEISILKKYTEKYL